VEMRRLHKMQPFKIWALEGVQPNERMQWYCALWGQVPHQGGLRDFWGEGTSIERPLAVASSCAQAASQLTRLLGSGDCVKWLKTMARVNMEVEEMPGDTMRQVLEAETEKTMEDYDSKLKKWLDARHVSGPVFEPPDFGAGPAATAPQNYEPEPDGGPMDQAKIKRGVPRLPVRDLRDTLAEELGESCCIVISGGTGSGKSTQIPQYILEDFRSDDVSLAASPSPSPPSASPRSSEEADENDEGPTAWHGPPRIIVTEPRRIAACSLAERVAWERGEPVGKSIGYSVRGDSKVPRGREGTIEYCTVGILLRRIQKDPRLRDVSHVLIDEVHERDLMTDFLLILLKELLCVRSDLRVLLMSATLDVKTFTGYLWGCPAMEIPSGPRFEVKEIYVEDMASESWAGALCKQLLDKEEDGRRMAEKAAEEAEEELNDDDGAGDEPAYRTSTGTWWGSAENDETYLEVAARLVMHLSEGPALVDDDGKPGSVLVFLPGWAEIKVCMERLQGLDYRSKKLDIASALHFAEGGATINFPAPRGGQNKSHPRYKYCRELCDHRRCSCCC